MTDAPKTEIKASAGVTATFDAKAGQSQTVLLSLVVAAVVVLILSFALFYCQQTGPAVLFFMLGATGMGCCFRLWSTSQSDSDLAAAAPTSITSPDGTNFSTDIRALKSPEGVENLVRLMTVIFSRKHLPEPIGLVGPGGVLVPDSRQAAIAVATDVHIQAQAATNSVIEDLGLSDNSIADFLQHLHLDHPQNSRGNSIDTAALLTTPPSPVAPSDRPNS